MPLTQEEKREMRRRFQKRRFVIALPRDLHGALKHCAYVEGRSMSNLIAATMWRYMQEQHGIKFERGVVNYSWGTKKDPPKDPQAQAREEIDKLLRDTNVGGTN